LCALLTAIGSQARSEDRDWAAEARKAREAKDFERAAASYRKLLEVDPANPRLLTNLGVMLYLSGKPAESLPILQAALQHEPGSIPASLFAGLSLLDLNRPREALPLLNRARAGDSKGPLPSLGLAKAHLSLGDVRRANDHYLEVTRKDPRNAEAFAGLGLTYSKMAAEAASRFWDSGADEATVDKILREAGMPSTRAEMTAVEDSLRQRPSDPRLNARFARSCIALAAASWQAAVELDRSSFDHRMGLGDSLVGADRPEDAIKAYEAAMRLRPRSTTPHLRIAAVARAEGDRARALLALGRAVELEPDNALANALLGDTLCEERDYPQARPYLEKALKLDPGLAPARAALAKIYSSEDRLELALEEIERALPDDKDGRYYYMLGRALQALGRSEEARKAFGQFKARRALKAALP
jgi:tetratricopeptide (TPR) repeat protein